MQGRGNRGGRGSYTSRHNSHDGSNRNAVSGKENEIIKVANEGVIIPPATHDKKNKEKSMVASSSSNIAPDIPLSEKTSTAPDGNLSASDPILMPSPDSRIPVGTIKREWQPKPTNPIPISIPVQVQVQAPETSDSIPVPVIPLEPLPTPESTIPESKEPKLSEPESESESHIPDTQHVIILNLLHVPEAEKLGFRFGSFDFNSISLNKPVIVTCPLSEPSEKIIGEEEHEVVTSNNEYDPDHSSEKDDVASHEPKQDPSPSPPRQQHPVISFGFMPPVIGTHIAPIENTDSQNASIRSSNAGILK